MIKNIGEIRGLCRLVYFNNFANLTLANYT
jgi:hypothetical protein